MNMEPLHRILLLRWIAGAHAMSQVVPRQQFSVKYVTKPFIVAKFAE
jgi:hypothetical protein